MNRTLWIHQFDQWQPIYGNEPIAPIIAQQGFNRVAVKALDGATWMNAYDTSSDAIGSIAMLQSWLASFHKAGLAMDVWMVPTKDTWPQAMELYRDILLNLPGRLIFDLEPYQGFWGDQSPVYDFLTTLLAQGPASVTYDPRVPGWLDIWYNRFSVHMPQVYDRAWIPDVKPRGRPCEVLLSTSQHAIDWWAICRDSVLGSEDGRTGFGVFRGPVLGAEFQGTLRGLT